ncbi:MAG: cell division protein FtsW [Austwickia sp.]|jgi:cell division protein FtsW|nr:MAG: cell division protein FtsW [Austwickia sp.]
MSSNIEPDRAREGRADVTTSTDRREGALAGATAAPAPDADQAGGRPPEPHPLLARLDSPLSTYYLLVGSISALLGIGLIMVLSASSVSSLRDNNSMFTVGLNQAKFAAIGVVGAVVVSRLPVRTWQRLGVGVIAGAIVMQLLVFTSLGHEVLGNRNWLRFGGFSVQPSEFGKLGIILYGAHILTVKRRLLGDWRHAVIPLVPAAGLVIALVLAGGDLGTTIVLIGILFSILWTSGLSARLFGFAAAGGAVLVLIMARASQNRMARITSWLSCDTNSDDALCWQSKNGAFALADGGLLGQGPGASREKWGWLPEQHNDFIFAIIGEELGLVGTLTILLLIGLITYACYRVILQTDDRFVRIATAGVMGWIVVQSVVNIGAVLGLLPVIGVPLPLVSAGGSALITTLLGLGMVISFARSEPACARALAGRPRVLARSLSVMSPLRKRTR